MRSLLMALSLMLCPVMARAQVSVSVGVNIGFSVPVFPELVLVPGYPVYYAPQAPANYFYYDGLYWVYQGDRWYMSSWYDGPWQMVDPDYVPLYLLRVPVRYYRQPPVYFRAWAQDAPPRWGEHWGRNWEQHRRGWDRWDRRSGPPPAPLPAYQREYSGDRYPRALEQQQTIRTEKYRYQPREVVTKQHYQQKVSPRPASTQPAPMQQPQPSRPAQQVQPVQQAPQMQHPQGAPQDKGRETRAAPQDRGRAGHASPPEKGRETQAAPQDRGRETQAAPQDKGPETQAAPQDKGQKNKGQKEKGQKNKAEGRGQDDR